jgi:hypothetical protein
LPPAIDQPRDRTLSSEYGGSTRLAYAISGCCPQRALAQLGEFPVQRLALVVPLLIEPPQQFNPERSSAYGRRKLLLEGIVAELYIGKRSKSTLKLGQQAVRITIGFYRKRMKVLRKA